MTDSKTQPKPQVKVTVKLKVPTEVFDTITEWAKGQDMTNSIEEALKNVCYFHLDGWHKMAKGEGKILTPPKPPELILPPGGDN